jgi:8-oxo-dGTP diphosphatase
MSKEKRPAVGVGVMITNEKDEILMGLRKGSHGAGLWCFPGGHVEFGETIIETAKREVEEETGLVINAFSLITVLDETEFIETDGKHFVVIGLKGVYSGGSPKVMEPEKCEEWNWFSADCLPENIYKGSLVMIENSRTGIVFRPQG